MDGVLSRQICEPPAPSPASGIYLHTTYTSPPPSLPLHRLCERSISIDLNTEKKFDSIAAFSGLLAFMHTLFALLLISWSSDFHSDPPTRSVSIADATSGGDEVNFRGSRQVGTNAGAYQNNL